jgi:uncharacterized RDD family membrane protein YckC
MQAPASASAGTLVAPSLARRLASFLYEGVLLFGICFAVGLIYGVATQQRNALQGRSGLDASLFVAIGLYFVICWARSGQTLPMQTWHLRLVDRLGQPVPVWRALLRYLLAWIWFLPPLAALRWSEAHGKAAITLALIVWPLAYAALSLALPQRQFLHDLLAGTRLIDWRQRTQPRRGSARAESTR